MGGGENQGANGIAASQRGGEPECGAEDGLGVEATGDQLWDQGEAGHRRPPRADGAGQRRLRPAGLLKSQLPPQLPVLSSPIPPNIFLQLMCICSVCSFPNDAHLVFTFSNPNV